MMLRSAAAIVIFVATCFGGAGAQASLTYEFVATSAQHVSGRALPLEAVQGRVTFANEPSSTASRADIVDFVFNAGASVGITFLASCSGPYQSCMDGSINFLFSPDKEIESGNIYLALGYTDRYGININVTNLIMGGHDGEWSGVLPSDSPGCFDPCRFTGHWQAVPEPDSVFVLVSSLILLAAASGLRLSHKRN